MLDTNYFTNPMNFNMGFFQRVQRGLPRLFDCYSVLVLRPINNFYPPAHGRTHRT
jgi:hypothetical protein